MTDYRRITDKDIDVDALLAEATDQKMGGIVAFIGTVRDNSEAGNVDGIFYDSYVPMAEKRMRKVEDEIKAAYPTGKIVMQHRVGNVAVKGVTVVVAASAPHRAEAFDACRLGIEKLKQEVPIWKRESLVKGGHRWVKGDETIDTKKRRKSR